MYRLKARVYDILADQFAVSVKDISDDIGPGDLAAWDSFGQIQLIMRLEDEFGLQLSIDDIMSINNVKDIIALAERSFSKKGAESLPDKKTTIRTTITPSLILPKSTLWDEGSIVALHKVEQDNIAVITGSSSYASEIKEKIKQSLPSKAGVSFVQKMPGEPTESNIYKIAERLKEISPKLIIAIGGGSCLDAAKLSWALYEHPELKLDNMLVPFSLPSLRRKASFIAIPTTFGSGSEVSSAATFSKHEASNKIVIVSHEFIPDWVILDHSLGKTAPLNTIYGSAFDALSHAIEGYASIISNPLTDPYAVYSVKNILKALKDVQQAGVTSENMRLLCHSAYYAGIVQNHCSVGLTHSIAHQLGEYGISHGTANALFLPSVMEYNAKGTAKYKQLAIESGFKSLDNLIRTIHSLFASSHILPDSNRLRKIVDNKDSIIELAMKDVTFRSNPIILKKNDLNSLFNKFERKFLS